MRNKKISSTILALIISMVWVSNVSPLSRPMHRDLNERIAERSTNNFSLNEYLINQLGFKEGLEEILKSDSKEKNVKWWLGEGGDKEDEPEQAWRLVLNIARNNNHFHNPLGGLWEYSGLDAYFWSIPILHYTGESSILWAQNPNQAPGGRWSWYDARNYFYDGLTSPVKEQRDSSFAKAFRALGQLMHLIQDASVPAHGRNEIHKRFHYEPWLEKIRTDKNEIAKGTFEKFIKTPISFDQSILDLVPSSLKAPVPIANIVDTDRYGGNNPDITVTPEIGMAEYANANFFGEDTVFSKVLPYPARTSVDIEDRDVPDPRGVKPSVMRPYYIKKRDGESSPSGDSQKQGKQGYRLATVGFLYNYIKEYFPADTYLDKPALDGGVYNDYAEKLLPRAVGYSAGLLDYFFRGNIEVTLENIEGSIKEGYTRVILKAKNITAGDEEMPEGSIALVAKYRLAPGGEFRYLTSPALYNIQSISRGDPATELTFDLRPNPIPGKAIDLSFQVVYRGKLGRQEGGVWKGEVDAVAVGLKALNFGIEITLPEDGVYAQTENRDQGFARVTFLAKNTTPNGEEMTDGSTELMVSYKLALQDPFQPVPVDTTNEFYYIVVPEANNTRSIPRANPVDLVFNLPENNPIPINATDLYLQVVYKGKLGKMEGKVWKGELNAVVLGPKDISEPTPIDIYNDMDRVCLNGNWYVAGSPEAIAQVDTNNDGIADLSDVYPHDLKDMYIRFSSTADPQNASSTEYNLYKPLLAAGEFFIRRAFVLGDYEFSYGYMVSRVVNKDPNDPYVHWYEPEVYPYKGVKNQTEPGTPEQCMALDRSYPCNIRYYPDRFYSFRGQQIWEWVVFQNSSYPPDASCPLE